MSSSPISFYSASAGSGKTYTLAKDYLTLLFQQPYNNGYRRILAVTFTNKAVTEMKQRILDYLYKFTADVMEDDIAVLALEIQKSVGLDAPSFKKKAGSIFNQLLHDYSAFDVVTIDSFNHRILRTFAKDIDLPDNFEVELDSNRLISKAIHNLIARSGKEKKLTNLLVEFSLHKIEEGKSWDIERDLQNIAGLIRDENHYKYLKQLKNKKVEDFYRFRESVQKKIQCAQEELKIKGNQILQSLNDNALTSDDFHFKASRAYKFITNCAEGIFKIDPKVGYVKDMDTAPIANKNADTTTENTIESLRPKLVLLSQFYTMQYGAILFYKNISSSLTPLSLINELLQEIEKIKADEQIVPIYEFNALLAEQIKDEPAPFIYERLGERYRHYFIDEFQDTSRMQWENLEPLIENEIHQIRENDMQGSLMLVGDAKQSIYRWRGGDADQFLRLLAAPQLFHADKINEPLNYNWRSYDEIISFNNDFFEFYGNRLQSEVYKDLYHNFLKQKNRSKPGGYIQIDFLDKDATVADEDDMISTAYPYQVYRQILQAQKNGFSLGDICVLVRKNKEGHEIAKYLVTQNMRVVSGDSLLVHASHKVQLLISLMYMVQMPDQQKPRLDFLMTYTKVFEIDRIHQFMEQYLKLSLSELSTTLLKDSYVDLSSAFAKAPLYQATVKVADTLRLFKDQDTRLQSFMEFLFEYVNGYEVSLSGFLEHWELKKEKLSVPAAPDAEAVQVMTIHKSKGLEFPVVIVPHCDVKIDDSRNATGWVPIDPESHEGFEYAYLTYKSECAYYPSPVPDMFADHLEKAQMDQINTLYVAFTRAREQLYISASEPSEKGTSTTYAHLLQEFINEQQIMCKEHTGFKTAVIGDPTKKSISKEVSKNHMLEGFQVCIDDQRLSMSIKKGLLWASGASEAIEKGNVLHEYLSLIKSYNDKEKVFRKLDRDFTLSKQEQSDIKEKINTVLTHIELKSYYKEGIKVLNEAPILLPNGKKLIPDRVVLTGNKAIVIDYKTGIKLDKHKNQLEEYSRLLQSMNMKVVEKVLIYTDEIEIVKWIE